MGYPTELQIKRRKTSDQWYVNIPLPVAEAMELDLGEVWEWIVEDKDQLVLRRKIASESALIKKNGRGVSREHLLE
jgi:bifunctional DNA-binding transcriptional regulator/antitoxin component of YhaV-PrlF toxin-antitoxin module